MDRASDSGSEGWGFESLRARYPTSHSLPCSEPGEDYLSIPVSLDLDIVAYKGRPISLKHIRNG